MNKFFEAVLKVAGLLFLALILAFTGYQTWSLLYAVSESVLTSVLGLVLFEASMLYWWLFFQNSAEGLPQMALSLMAAVLGLLLVGGATAIHLGAFSAEVVGSSTPARLITVAAILNLVVKFTMPLLHPDVVKSMYQKAAKGRILAKAYQALDVRSDAIAEELADQLALD